MVALAEFALPFMLISLVMGRRWTLWLPLAFWLLFYLGEVLGVLPGVSTLVAIVLTGGLGVLAAAAGLGLRNALGKSKGSANSN